MKFEDFKDPEFQEKLKNASSPEDLLALAKEAGFELTDEQLETVSGGGYDWGCWEKKQCVDVCSKYDAEWMHECWKYKKPQGPVDCAIH